jgi:hypothetical protein
LISPTGGTKKKIQIQLFITSKQEEKYTGRLNGPTFDLTYRWHEEGDTAYHHKQLEVKYKDKLNGPTFDLSYRGTKKETQLIITNNRRKSTQTDWTDPLLIYRGHGEEDKDPAPRTQTSQKKYTDRLNGPNFDLTYRGHEEGDPAHHDEHGWRKVHRQTERTHFWSNLPTAQRRRSSSSSQTRRGKSTQTN